MRCQSGSCEAEAITAIRSTVPRGKSLVTTIWQEEADAPATAQRYCGTHGVNLAANLTALTDSRLRPTVTVEVDE